MPNLLTHIFERIGQKALEKSRAYYHPLPTSSDLWTSTAQDGEVLSDASFAAMLEEIDAFSAQLRSRSVPKERASSTRIHHPDSPQQTYNSGDRP